MIPKVIHFCWLSNEPYPDLIKKCIESWKEKLPDYAIKKWDTTNFDVTSVPFVKEAYECKKWAFAADYIRLHALYTEGGIYLDSDVRVLKSFDVFLSDPAFSAIEFNPKMYPIAVQNGFFDDEGNLLYDSIQIGLGLQVQAAVIGAEKGNSYIKSCLDYYVGKNFILADGLFNNKIILPDIMAFYARNFGFKYINREQKLLNVKFYVSEVFAPHPKLVTSKSYAIHCCTGTWRKKTWLRKFIEYIRHKLY
ncbi:glycosyltransferase family 32 protein [Bacteroides cellulosilyticus]|jgi:hypothetical protein|uniref:Polysaccharide biosynthesis protein n=2 Tax=Bacteroides cellulosilyticus TaxID=246787 RepID=A0A108T462_9BACE|nr:glycosyltransferase [Bacteroides cellulosilyticus]KAA5412076.1 polysaccharide biosynthesis protein [Bacteroides cellulosilyticus]KWR53071.1 mannosyltransferase OCH1 [Bacteroides cellulosilyticus]